MARKSVVEQIKMLCLSNKKEITEIKVLQHKLPKNDNNFGYVCCLYIRKWAAASASFCFCSSGKYFSSYLIQHYFVTILYLNLQYAFDYFPFSEIS